MFRRAVQFTPLVPLVFAPVAFADDKIKNIYDDSVGENLPGTASAHQPVQNAVSQLEQKIDNKLEAETVAANGLYLRYNEQLKSAVGAARENVEYAYDKSVAFTHDAINTVFKGERSVTSTLSSLRSPDEQLLPASIYVLIAALSGSVISRPRNILVRAITPVVFGVGAFAYFLPKTAANTSDFIYALEKEHASGLADAQDAASKQFEQAKKGTLDVVQESESSLKSFVKKSRAQVEQWTGLDFSGKANK